MRRHLTPRALERAQWFADLKTALTEAEKLLAILERDGGFPTETKRLRQRIEAIQTELALLNRVVLGEGRIVSNEWPVAKAGNH